MAPASDPAQGGTVLSRQPAKALSPDNFVRGALIVTVATLAARLLGAFYRPIVTQLFAPFDGEAGTAGMGLVQYVYPFYLVMLSVSAYGINIAISRLVAERIALGQPNSAWRVFCISLALMAGLGLGFSVGTFFAADWLAARVGDAQTAPGFRAIAPAIFFVSVMAAFRGLFQGLRFMTPYALSQIYEQIVRIFTGLLLIWLLTRSADTVPLGAAGYNFGAATGALVGLAYLLWVFARQRGPAMIRAAAEHRSGRAEPVEARAPAWRIAGTVLRLAAPISVIGAVQSLVQWADALLVGNGLQTAGLTQLDARSMMGLLGNSYTITWLPPILTTALYLSLVPAITESLARGNRQRARHHSIIALRLTMLVGIPATVGIWQLANPIYALFFPGSPGGPVLRALAPLTLAMMLQQTTAGIVQGSGDIGTPVRNILLGLLGKVLFTYWWTGTPGIGVVGAAHASTLAFAVAAGLNLWAVRRLLGVTMGVSSMWAKPLAAAGVMAAAIWALDGWLSGLTRSPAVIAGLVVPAAAAYLVAMLIIRGFEAADFESIPGVGPRLVALLNRWRLLRQPQG